MNHNPNTCVHIILNAGTSREGLAQFRTKFSADPLTDVAKAQFATCAQIIDQALTVHGNPLPYRLAFAAAFSPEQPTNLHLLTNDTEVPCMEICIAVPIYGIPPHVEVSCAA